MRRLSIVMYGARQCNGLCQYCCSRASNNINKEKDNIIIDEEKLVAAINNFPKKFDAFQLWGTEPLLHFDEFKKLVEILERHFPNKRLASSTNGILLCDNTIKDYIISHNIQMQLSHDGPAQYLRTPFDVAENPNVIELAKRGLILVNCVTHKWNQDIKAIIDYWDNWKKTNDIPDINIRISLPMFGDNGEFAIDDLDNYFNQLELYWEHPYMHGIRYIAKTWRLNAGIRGCMKFAKKLSDWSWQIDTIGKYTKCNLLDSSQEPGNRKGSRNSECWNCKYRKSTICSSCVSLPMERKCRYNKRLNDFLTNRMEKYKCESTKHQK